jgi:hypothetical protein
MGTSVVLVAICLAIGLVTVASGAEKSPEDRYAYLHQTTNEVLSLRRSEPRISAKEAVEIAHRICETLQRLEKDPNFRKDLEGIAKPSKERTEYHQQLANDLDSFLSSFVPDEIVVLKKANLKEDATTQAIIAAAAARESLREPKNPDDVMKALARFRDDVCRSRDAMLKESDDKVASEKRWKKVKRWGLGLAGLSTVAADIVFAAPTGGVAAASISVGTGVITAVIVSD